MTVGFVRPDSSSLVLHLYGRSVHPELLRVFAQTTVGTNAFQACLRICDSGHTIGFRYDEHTITELTASRDQHLPQKKRLFEKALRGCRDESVRLEGGLKYTVSYQLERLEPTVFVDFHEELLADCKRAAVFHRFPAENRLSPEPISLMRTVVETDSLLVHAFHTFPESCTILKTQSLFEL